MLGPALAPKTFLAVLAAQVPPTGVWGADGPPQGPSTAQLLHGPGTQLGPARPAVPITGKRSNLRPSPPGRGPGLAPKRIGPRPGPLRTVRVKAPKRARSSPSHTHWDPEAPGPLPVIAWAARRGCPAPAGRASEAASPARPGRDGPKPRPPCNCRAGAAGPAGPRAGRPMGLWKPLSIFGSNVRPARWSVRAAL